MKDDGRFMLIEIKDFITNLITFIKYIPGYYKLHKNYEYEPETYDYIINNYEKVLCETTRTLSKPTYDWRTVVCEIDSYYERIYSEEIKRLEKDNGWILVEDQLPFIYKESNTSDIVLVQGYDEDVDFYWQAMGFYAEEPKQWFFADCRNTDISIDWIDIIAWQPLPEDYKNFKNHLTKYDK